MDLDCGMLNKTGKEKHCFHSYVNSINKPTKQKLHTLIETENKLVITGGVEGGKMNEMGEED